MITKQCTKCRQFKLLSEFSKQWDCKYHVKSICKACDTISRWERRYNKRITQHTLHVDYYNAEHFCCHCCVELDHERYIKECKRMKAEHHENGGIGERLPRCLDCQIKGF